MTTSALQFGPEWMRKAPASMPTSTVPPGTARTPAAPASTSPATNTGNLPSHLQSQMQDSEGRSSSYSSILSDFGQGPVTPVVSTDEEGGRPFRYSKEQMVSVWREGGGRGDLPIDVERWEGVTQEEGREPEAVREWNDEERRFFAGPVNSEPPRRRADTLNSPAEGPRERRETFSRLGGGQSSPMRERFGNTGVLAGGIAGRRRRDDPPGDLPPLRPRQSSFTGQPLSATVLNPPTPGAAGGRRTMGTFDGVLGREGGREEGVWARRKVADGGGVNGGGVAEKKRPVAGQGSTNSEGTGNATVAWSSGGGGLAAQLSRNSGDDAEPPLDRQHSPDTYHRPSFDPEHGVGLADSPEPVAFHGDLNGVNAGIGAMSIGDDYDGVRLATDSAQGLHGFQPPRSTSASSLAPDNVQWYYKDPTGLIQGPFAAATMQEWYEGSYFPDDLLLRREGEDTLEPLYEIKRRAGPVGKLFLSHVPPRAPPNLAQHQPVLHQHQQTMQSQAPFEPSLFSNSYDDRDVYVPSSAIGQPTSSHFTQRQSSLDAYSSISSINASSVPQASQHAIDSLYPLDSPIPYGPIGAGISPSDRERARQREADDYLRSRESLMAQQPALSSGVSYSRSGFSNGSLGNHQQIYDQSPSAGSLPQSFNERSGMQQLSSQQPYLTPLSIGSFSSRLPPSQGNTPVDSHSFGLQHPPQQQTSPWTTTQSQSHYQQLSQAPQQFDPAIISTSPSALAPRSPMYDMRQPQPQPQQQYGQGITFGQPEQPPQQSLWQSHTFPQQQPDDWPRSAHPQTQNPTLVSIDHLPNVSSFPGENGSERLQGPGSVSMGTQAPAAPFEPELPPAPEVHQITPAKPQPIARPRADSALQQHRQTSLVVDIPPVSESATESVPEDSARQAAAASQPAPIAPPVSVAAPVSTSTASAPKPSPWATAAPSSSEERPKPAHATSLRQIQESEARRAELRKAAERAERAKRGPATPAIPASDEPSAPVPVTQSWGLAAPSVSSRPAPSPAVEPPAPTATPWSKGGPAPKKTLKEIQEEEERQKNQQALAAAAKEGVPQVAGGVKRYADSAKNVASTNVGGAWNTVGAGGKVVTAAGAAPAVRPAGVAAPTAAVRVAATIPSQAGAPAAARTTSASQVQKAAKPASAPSSEAEGAALLPSAEFVKWLRDSLKGLNPGVNLDEYMQMLLSFPLDPSSSVIEIIQDSIYASSSTLDGRRFAAEFISRRKTDAAARKAAGVTTSGGSGKASLADVVKLQPKAAPTEWAYKTVVKKKGKGKN